MKQFMQEPNPQQQEKLQKHQPIQIMGGMDGQEMAEKQLIMV
jgi:hypothetical protein